MISLVECIATTAAVIVSLIAIFVSIYTLRVQNKIALFDKRYNSIYEIKNMLRFAVAIKDIDKPHMILTMFDIYFGTDFCDASAENALVKIGAKIEAISSNILQAKFIFKNCDNDLSRITDDWKGLMMKVVRCADFVEARDIFCEECMEFYENSFQKMKDNIDLTKL